MAKTKIAWADFAWNPVTGCSKVSEGCRHCYAEGLARRFNKEFKPWTVRNAEYNVRLHPERLDQPLHWKKPRRVFVNSVSDLFHEQVPFSFIAAVFGVMGWSKKQIFQILTKRPNRMLEFFSWLGALRGELGALECDPWIGCEIQAARRIDTTMQSVGAVINRGSDWPLPNVWLGFSAEDQDTFDERWKHLRQTPAAKRFVSLEPLLGPIILDDGPAGGGHTALTTETDHPEDTKLDWVIVGGESGPGARPMNPRWIRDIRDQCQAAGVLFFFKQWGEWVPDDRVLDVVKRDRTTAATTTDAIVGSVPGMRRVGKKAAGRELDGRTWEEMPT